MTLNVIIPTFREPEEIECILDDVRRQTFTSYRVVIVNANPGDRSSTLVEQYIHSLSGFLIELESNSNNYWAENINIGLRYLICKTDVNDTDIILFLNVDLRFNESFFQDVVNISIRNPKSIFVANTIAQNTGKPISSGIIMRSWIFNYTVHPEGKGDISPATMLVGRSLCMPVELIKNIGYVNSEKLPHYGADYEYSYRAFKLGYKLFVTRLVNVYSNIENSGLKSTKESLSNRIPGLFNIKSTYNIKYRVNFVLLTHPVYAIIPAVIITIIKCMIEAAFGRFAYNFRGTSSSLIK